MELTHEDLLAEIKREIKQCTCFPGNCEDENNRPWKALRAVVELHKPYKSMQGTSCLECSEDEYACLYPCQTIQAIEKELG